MANMKDIATYLSTGGYISNPMRRRQNPAEPSISSADIETLLAGGFIRENAPRKRKNAASRVDISALPQKIKLLEGTAAGDSLVESSITDISDRKSRLQSVRAEAGQSKLLQSYTDDQEQFEWVGLKGRMLCVDAAHIIPNQNEKYDTDLICAIGLAPTYAQAVLPIPMPAPVIDIDVPKGSTQGFVMLGSQGEVVVGAFLSGVENVCVQITNDLHKRYKAWVSAGKPTNTKDSATMRYLDRSLI